MVLTRQKRIEQAIEQLSQALKLYNKAKDDNSLEFLTVAKAFEIVVEYCWKELKRVVESEGLFASSPKEAVRQAANIGLIDQEERWIECINARNDSVHDYFGVPREDYISYTKEFIGLAKKMVNCLEKFKN